jgi:diguanylate cyclase (GGDEF)-like protein
MSVQACNEAKRLRLPISVMLLDIDYFKKVNDTYGHAAGDRVLKYLAKTIKSGKRDMDIAARFGGEEFILLLPFSDAEGSKNLAERIRKECEKAKITYEGKEISITLSAGIYSDLDTSNPCSISDSIQYADNALYMAKRQGRNQTVISPNSYIYQSSTV